MRPSPAPCRSAAGGLLAASGRNGGALLDRRGLLRRRLGACAHALERPLADLAQALRDVAGGLGDAVRRLLGGFLGVARGLGRAAITATVFVGRLI
jgi:hypothetical protein